MIIELLYETVTGELGPNFYFYGSPHDYLDFVIALHLLGEQDGINIALNDLNLMGIKNLTNRKIIFRSESKGKTLCSIKDTEIIVELPHQVWSRVLGYIFSISFYPSTQYIEFDELDLIEEANFIVESSCKCNKMHTL